MNFIVDIVIGIHKNSGNTTSNVNGIFAETRSKVELILLYITAIDGSRLPVSTKVESFSFKYWIRKKAFFLLFFYFFQ